MKEPDVVNFNRDVTYALLKLRGRPTLSTAAGRAIARTLGVTPKAGKRIFHGTVAASAAISLTRTLPADSRALGAFGVGILTYLFLEHFDRSR